MTALDTNPITGVKPNVLKPESFNNKTHKVREWWFSVELYFCECPLDRAGGDSVYCEIWWHYCL